MPKKALITGITGQDGSNVAELFLYKRDEVQRLVPRGSTFSTGRIHHVYTDPHEQAARLALHYANFTEGSRLVTLPSRIAPEEVYNLAAQSNVRGSFDEPEHKADTTGRGTTRLLQAIRIIGMDCRFYQASSSAMFGAAPPPQSAETPFYDHSPYGAPNVYRDWMTRNSQEGYGMFVVNGILFNHESPPHGETFVTPKITRNVALLRASQQDIPYKGHLDAARDWGYAPQYVDAMWRMLQPEDPSDFVVATRTSDTVLPFLQFAFDRADLDWHKHLTFDDRYLRLTEVDPLIGDASKAAALLRWKPQVVPKANRIATIANAGCFGVESSFARKSAARPMKRVATEREALGVGLRAPRIGTADSMTKLTRWVT